MRKSILSLTMLALSWCSVVNVLAQDDSSRLDAGYLSLKKEFTQAITIKGSDLEKMPFANLSDAISAWSYGAYTRAKAQAALPPLHRRDLSMRIATAPPRIPGFITNIMSTPGVTWTRSAWELRQIICGTSFPCPIPMARSLPLITCNAGG